MRAMASMHDRDNSSPADARRRRTGGRNPVSHRSASVRRVLAAPTTIRSRPSTASLSPRDIRTLGLPRPDRCFGSLQEAELAGSSVAEPPPGSKLIGGIYLVPTDDDLRADCKRAARSIKSPVACPMVLPATPPCSWTCGEAARCSKVVTRCRKVRPRCRRAPVGDLHPTGSRRRRGRVQPRPPPHTHHDRGHPATLIECGEASELHGGHVVLVWNEAGGGGGGGGVTSSASMV